MDLIEIYRAFHLKEAEYTFISSKHGIFSTTDHIMDHKPRPGEFLKVEIVKASVSNDSMRNPLQGKAVKNTNMWRLNNM